MLFRSVILGDDEMKEGAVQVKSLRKENVQLTIKFDDLVAFLLEQKYE